MALSMQRVPKLDIEEVIAPQEQLNDQTLTRPTTDCSKKHRSKQYGGLSRRACVVGMQP